jgi:hypothetical protein
MATKRERRQTVDSEIEAGRNDIRTDKLDISYGELANLFENEELVIRPEFQRLFRWSSTQKTRFIESILLGFPTPAIFVAEDAKGIWELVDGLQRVSTVLEFMGVLKDETGDLQPPSSLVRAGHKPRIPSLENMTFADLSLQARLAIKRAGCRVEVIKIGSKPTMKYEVFERLNTGGSELTPQEVRNCIFRATNPEFVEWIEDLAKFGPFSDNLLLSELQENTMFDRGLILRYFTLKNAWQEFEHDVEPFITDFIRQILEEERSFNRPLEDRLFRETFRLIAKAMAEDSWRHYRNGKHKGPLSVYVFETVSAGVALNIEKIRSLRPSDLKKRIIKFKQHPTFINNTGAGANIKSKLHNRMSFACEYFR